MENVAKLLITLQSARTRSIMCTFPMLARATKQKQRNVRRPTPQLFTVVRAALGNACAE